MAGPVTHEEMEAHRRNLIRFTTQIGCLFDNEAINRHYETDDLNEPVSTWGDTSLHIAVEAQAPKIVSHHLQHGANVNIARHFDGATALHVAARHPSFPILEVLLAAGAPVTSKDNRGYTALARAIESGQNDFIPALIRRGSDVNARTKSGDTPLHLAIDAGNVAAVRELVKHDANPSRRNKSLWTPLHDAVTRCKYIPLATPGSGSDSSEFSFLSSEDDDDGSSDDDDVIVVDLEKRTEAMIEIIQILIEAGASPTKRDASGETPLHRAVLAEDSRVTSALLARGTGITRDNRDGQTALEFAAAIKRWDLVDIYLDHLVATDNLAVVHDLVRRKPENAALCEKMRERAFRTRDTA